MNLPQEQQPWKIKDNKRGNIRNKILDYKLLYRIVVKNYLTKQKGKYTANELSEDDEYYLYILFFLHNSDKIRLQIKYIFFCYNHYYICGKECVLVSLYRVL